MIACLDLEGVLVPEIWIEFAEATQIPELKLTTRDIADYDQLMQHRLRILSERGLRLGDIQEVIAKIRPLPGAQEFLAWLRDEFQIIILSDTFYPFAKPLMQQLGYPTLFCHHLDVDASGHISNYRLRLPDQKRAAVEKLKALNFKIIASGDSYNDINMLQSADVGVLFCPPEKLVQEYPQFEIAKNYEELKQAFLKAREVLQG